MKRITFILIALAVVALAATRPSLMLSPGKLTQGHQNIKNNCTACHHVFHGIESARCIACHKVDEIGRDKLAAIDSPQQREVILFHSQLKEQQCISCHTDHQGLDPTLSVSGFDHTLLTADMQKNCQSCHARPQDSLHQQLDVSCASCHNTGTWTFSGAFDHSLLTGTLKTQCTACHQKPDDTFHQSIQESCSECHTTEEWKPSTYDHSTYFVLDGDHNTRCITCHPSQNFKVYTCYGCHEHSEANIREEHNEHGIYSFQDCASCHRSGDEHDIRNFDRRKEGGATQDVKGVREYIRNGKEHGRKEHDD